MLSACVLSVCVCLLFVKSMIDSGTNITLYNFLYEYVCAYGVCVLIVCVCVYVCA